MKNNSIGTVAVSNTKRPRARFNLSSDLHTTMDFGSVIPARVHLQVPNSKVVCSSKERILCSPMLAPTMGRLSLKAYHNFVRLTDLTENFTAMLGQEAVSRSTNQFVPLKVPTIPLRDLSLFILYGASCQFYKRDTSGGQTNTDDDVSQWTNTIYSGTGANLTSDSDLSALGLLNLRTFTYLDNLSAYGFDPNLIYNGAELGTNPHPIPLSNPRNNTFYPLDPSTSYVEGLSRSYDTSDITPDNADVVLPITVTGGALYYLCFRLSDFGKRLRKVLIGCGYQIDFNSTSVVSVMPMLAFYKSYFDVFGLTLYTNWEQSFAARFLSTCDLTASPAIGSVASSIFSDNTWSISQARTVSFFFMFIVSELANCYYTDEQDFVSSHTTTTGVSPASSSFISSINTDVDYTGSNVPRVSDGSVQNPQVSLPGNPNGHAFISNIIHGQLDSELLKRLYRWTNRNTVAGRRIAELLRAQGLGSYVDECKSDFIGSFELPIDVFDGTSSSDTYSPAADSGAPLGERFGIGEASSGLDRNKSCERSFTFECNEFGYWVTLFTIVPKGGYAECLDPTVLASSKFEFYNPEFDSLGMEFDPKSLVVGSQPFADYVASSGSLSDSFGLVPRYFRWKFGRNVVNGDFNRRSRRSTFAPYYLDKVIDVGNRDVVDGGSNSTTRRYIVSKLFKPSMLPIAGNVWRYPTRYSFIGQFNRIFNYQGRRLPFDVGTVSQIRHELFDVTEDNFILHAIFDVQYFAPMLPVEDSFETYDDDNAVNGSMSKA